MTTQGCAIGHDDFVAQLTIVGDMRVRHEQVVIADLRHALIVGRAAIHRDEFAKHVAVADFEARWLALVLLVLRRIA